jgi:D-serine deaminase-like pyridoxal phosphate-dependent protein
MTDRTYFDRLSAALVDAELHRPVLVIDRDRLDNNIEVIRKGLAPGLGLRIVDKSLSSILLMQRILSRCNTTRIMSFHLPMTLAMLATFPEAEILFGKPVPVGGLAAGLRHLSPTEFEDLLRRSVFLIDSMGRLEQYTALALGANHTFRIAFEVDVGMHRGGFAGPQALATAVARASEAGAFVIEGVMAYDAHIPQLPSFLGGAGEQARVEARLAAFVSVLPQSARRIVNTGGSKTALTYRKAGSANEVSIGSAFVKPTDFDIRALAALQPAVFIATPILKVGEMRLPGPAVLTYFMQALGRFPKQGCFLYGGKWMADPVHPEGLSENRLWGLSSNQQMMRLPSNCSAKADDFAVFRPTQSEAVLQQFGSLHVLSGGRIEEKWPALPLD